MNASSFPSKAMIVALSWLARLLALAVAGLILAIFIGEGFHPAKLKTRDWILMVPFFVTWLGLVTGWRWEGLGGSLVVAGMAAFYLIHFVQTGFGQFPRGWAFPMIAVPGVLFLACWFGRRKLAASAPPPY